MYLLLLFLTLVSGDCTDLINDLGFHSTEWVAVPQSAITTAVWGTPVIPPYQGFVFLVRSSFSAPNYKLARIVKIPENVQSVTLVAHTWTNTDQYFQLRLYLNSNWDVGNLTSSLQNYTNINQTYSVDALTMATIEVEIQSSSVSNYWLAMDQIQLIACPKISSNKIIWEVLIFLGIIIIGIILWCKIQSIMGWCNQNVYQNYDSEKNQIEIVSLIDLEKK